MLVLAVRLPRVTADSKVIAGDGFRLLKCSRVGKAADAADAATRGSQAAFLALCLSPSEMFCSLLQGL